MAISLGTGLATVLLPLLGARLTDRPLARLRVFPPPVEIPVQYPRFSWVAAGLILVALMLVMVWVVMAPRPRRELPSPKSPRVSPLRRRFPWWGWVAVGWTLVWWLLAWSRLDLFEWGQRFTFFPLWSGFIVVANALAWRRYGTTWLSTSPARTAALFGLSAGFWWMFEWLNRFVLNWHYLGVVELGPAGYAAHATLSFATVLPAVTAVRDWLGADRSWLRWFVTCTTVSEAGRRRLGKWLLVLGVAGLVGTGAWPQILYPALWLAPLFLAAGALLVSHPEAFAALAEGDWRPLANWALAALVCGFFWEMWNTFSLARWVYVVPYAQRWHLFEMPLLGYLGYLPFGWLCGLAVTGLRVVWSRSEPGWRTG